jgi:DNA gyrase/topoisomerase IV subunit A
MTQFLTTSGTSFCIEKVIIEAKSELYLLSPYLQISKTLYERLRDCSNKGVKIKIIYGKDELKPTEKNQLLQLKTVELFFSENLHAKCYFNENQMVLTSMNMYEFSEKNNREMGVFIDRNKDPNLFENAKIEALSILNSSQKKNHVVNTTKNFKVFNIARLEDENSGSCIRCSNQIPLNQTKPLCKDCYKVWFQFGDANFPENYCHSCGNSTNSRFNKPFCYSCYLEIEFKKDTGL